MASSSCSKESSILHSLTAYQILEENGVSDILVQYFKDYKDEMQFLMTTFISTLSSVDTIVIAGSVAEGLHYVSALSGEKTDIDVLKVHHSFKAIQTLEDVISDPSLYQFLIVKNEDNPAYVKLRLISEGNNYFDKYFCNSSTLVKASNGMQYLSSSEIKIKSKMTSMGVFILNILPMLDMMESISINGPATSFNLQNVDLGFRNGFSVDKMDEVFAIPCPFWPDAAKEWVRRHRFYKWPSLHLVRRISSQGCHLVPKSRSESSVKNLKWVLSFSHVEPLLIHSMNNVMIKTYCILKLVQRFVFQVELGDVISSYIMKTAIFWEVEESDILQWKPENLLLCVRRCLKRVKDWIDQNFAPQYFIRDQNLLQRSLAPCIRQKASDCLSSTIDSLDNLFQNIMPFVITLRSRTKVEVVKKFYNSDEGQQRTELLDKLSQGTHNVFLILSSLIVPIIIGSSVGRHSSSNWTSLDSLRQVIYRVFKNQAPTVPHLLTLSTLIQKSLFLELIKHGRRSKQNKETYQRRNLSSKIMRLCKITLPVLSLSNLLVHVLQCLYLGDCHKMATAVDSIMQCLCKSRTLKLDCTNYKNLVSEVCGHILKNHSSIYENSVSQKPIVVITDFSLTHIELKFLPPILNLELECRFNVDKDIDPILRPPNENVLLVDTEVLFYFVAFCFFHYRDKNIDKYSYLQKLRRLCWNESTMHLHVALNLLGYCQLLMDQHREAFMTYFRSLCVQMRNRGLRTLSKATRFHVAILLHKCFSDEWSKTS